MWQKYVTNTLPNPQAKSDQTPATHPPDVATDLAPKVAPHEHTTNTNMKYNREKPKINEQMMHSKLTIADGVPFRANKYPRRWTIHHAPAVNQ